MQKELLELLRCPQTGEGLVLEAIESKGDEIISGNLMATSNSKIKYSIVEGVPRLLKNESIQDKTKEKDTQKAFGFEWKQFKHAYDFNKSELIDLLSPFLDMRSLKGKVILDAGCGSGMYTRIFKEYHPGKIIALDYSEAIDVAHQRLLPDRSCHCVQGSIMNPCLAENSFDFILSKGVLHHLPDPQKGFSNLVRLLKPGGVIVIWVYGKNNNIGFSKLLTPLREKIFVKLPLFVEYFISFLMAAPFYLLLKLIYAPVRFFRIKFLQKTLPYYELFSEQSRYPFTHIHFGVFDQMTAPITFYYDRDEILEWF